MQNYSGTIGSLADEVVAQARSDRLVKTAQQQFIAEYTDNLETEIGRALMKTARLLKHAAAEATDRGVSMAEFERFIGGGW